MQNELFINNNVRKYPTELILLRKLWVGAVKNKQKALNGTDRVNWEQACDNENFLFDQLCTKYDKQYKVFEGLLYWTYR